MDRDRDNDGWPAHIILAPLFLVVQIGVPCIRRSLFLLRAYRERVIAIEGKLAERLRDGTIRLLRVPWLLARPDDWTLTRRQDLPSEAFWEPREAAKLLAEHKVRRSAARMPRLYSRAAGISRA